MCFSWRKSFSRETSANAVSRTWSWRNQTPLRYDWTFTWGFLHEYFIRHIWHDYGMLCGFLNLIWTTAIFVNLQYEQGPVDAGACVCHCTFCCQVAFFGCLKWHDKCCSAITFTQGLCNNQMGILKWFSGFYLCMCVCVQHKEKLEKLRAQAEQMCTRLGRFRMPFAWTAIHLLNIVSSVGGLDRSDSDSDTGINQSQHIWIQLRVCFLLLSYN